MGQVFLSKESIGTFSQFSTTRVQLTTSVITLGAKQYTNSSTIYCDISVSGLDTGSIAASSLYYVYAVVSGGVLGLVCSLSSFAPTGFTFYKKIGYFLY